MVEYNCLFHVIDLRDRVVLWLLGVFGALNRNLQTVRTEIWGAFAGLVILRLAHLDLDLLHQITEYLEMQQLAGHDQSV